MTRYRLRHRRPGLASIDPVAYTTTRLWSLLFVAAAAFGAIAESLSEAAGASIPFAVGIGLGLFVAAATFATTLAARTASAASYEPATRRSLRYWAEGSHLGPDAEQVIGRKTGARV